MRASWVRVNPVDLCLVLWYNITQANFYYEVSIMKKSLLVAALILLIPFMFFASEVSETVTDILESGFVDMKDDVAVG